MRSRVVLTVVTGALAFYFVVLHPPGPAPTVAATPTPPGSALASAVPPASVSPLTGTTVQQGGAATGSTRPAATAQPGGDPGEDTPLLTAATAAATSFAQTFIAYIYAGAPVSSVMDATDDVRAALPGLESSAFSPVERSQGATITDVNVTEGESAGTAHAATVVTEGQGGRYQLSFDLRQLGAVWVVDTVPTLG